MVCVPGEYEIHWSRFSLGHSTGRLLAAGLPGVAASPGRLGTLNPDTNLGGGGRWFDRVDPSLVLVTGAGRGLGEIVI